MAKEIERKFLVASSDWRASARPGSRLVQFYVVAEEDRSVRVRIRDGQRAKLTMKFGTQAKIRDEFEFDIPLDQAEELRGFARGTVIEKTRSIVHHAGYDFEVDEFAGGLAGLLIAELETPDDVADADLPTWLGREITGEPGFYNASLALHGLPPGSTA